MKKNSQNIAFILSFALLLLIASCGARKNTSTTAAKAANTMANLKSKKLYRFINEWAGTPYLLGGLSRKGIDCSGFSMLLEKEIYNEKLPRRSIEQAAFIKEINLTKLKEGDLIFFSFGGKEIDHVGIYLNNDMFVHASTQRGVIVDDLSFTTYQKALVKAGTLKK